MEFLWSIIFYVSKLISPCGDNNFFLGRRQGKHLCCYDDMARVYWLFHVNLIKVDYLRGPSRIIN